MPECTAAKLLSGMLVASPPFRLRPAHPDCQMLEGAHLRRRTRGRSALLIGDCWERRLLEHACPKGRLRSYAPEEPFAVACELYPNVTFGHLHLAAIGDAHPKNTAPHYMPERQARSPRQLEACLLRGRLPLRLCGRWGRRACPAGSGASRCSSASRRTSATSGAREPT